MNSSQKNANQAMGSLLSDLSGCSILKSESFWNVLYSVHHDLSEGVIGARGADDFMVLFKQLVVEKALGDAKLTLLFEQAIQEAALAIRADNRVIIPGYLTLDYELSQDDYPTLISKPITKPFGMEYVEQLKADAKKNGIDIFIGPSSPFEKYCVQSLIDGLVVEKLYIDNSHILFVFLCLYKLDEWHQNQIESFVLKNKYVDPKHESLSREFRKAVNGVNEAGKDTNSFALSRWNNKEKYRLHSRVARKVKVRICLTPFMQAYFGKLLSSAGISE